MERDKKIFETELRDSFARQYQNFIDEVKAMPIQEATKEKIIAHIEKTRDEGIEKFLQDIGKNKEDSK